MSDPAEAAFAQGQSLLAAGRADDARERFEQVAASATPAIRYAGLLGLARACLALGSLERAEAVARQACLVSGTDCTGHAMLALVLQENGRLAAAGEAAAAALARAPGTLSLLNLAAGIALRRGGFAEAAALIEACLRVSPSDRRALSYRPALQAALGETETWPDLCRYLRRIDIAPPAGYASCIEFGQHVAEAVAAAPGLRRAEAGKTLVGGARLASITTLPRSIADGLTLLFGQAVAVYADMLAATNAVDPIVLACRPAHCTIVAWASVMAAADYERPHIHEAGWVSGVFYAEVPAPDPGGIVFGGHDLPPTLLPPGPQRCILPGSGDLLVFPACLTHRTLPFTQTGRRITVAFDARGG